MLQACAMNQAGYDYKRIMPMVQCMQSNADADNMDEATKACASTFGFDFQQILRCASSSKGRNLMKKIGEKTKAFRPKIKRVPTVAFNGVSCLQSGPLYIDSSTSSNHLLSHEEFFEKPFPECN